MLFKEGDNVIVVSGDDKGETGTIQRIIREKNRVVVSGVNMVKKHQRPQQAGGRQVQGGIIEFEAPIDASKVMHVDPDSGEPTRIGVRITDDGTKVRFAKKSGKDID